MKILQADKIIRLQQGVPAKASGHSGTEELSSAIDLAGLPEFHSGLLVSDVGAATGTPDSFSVVTRLLECDTSGGTYTAVSGVTVTRTTSGVSSVPFKPGSCKRYVKVGRTVTIVNGTSPTVPNAGHLLLVDPKYGPA